MRRKADARVFQNEVRLAPRKSLSALALLLLCQLHAVDGLAAEELTAASGFSGAGTRLDAAARGRLWTDIGVCSHAGATAIWSLLGAGLRLSGEWEMEALLPGGYGWEDADEVYVPAPPGADIGQSARTDYKAWLGNPYVGVNFLVVREAALRARLGAGLGLPLASWDERDARAELLPYFAAGLQDRQLSLPRRLSLAARGRVEASADAYVLAADLVRLCAKRSAAGSWTRSLRST